MNRETELIELYEDRERLKYIMRNSQYWSTREKIDQWMAAEKEEKEELVWEVRPRL